MILNLADNMMLGDKEILKVCVGEEEVWTRSGVKELTGVPPLSFTSDGTNLIDWRIKGNSGGVGDLGVNKLNFKAYNDNTVSNNYGGYIDMLTKQNVESIVSVSIPSGANTYDQQRWATLTTDMDRFVFDYRPDTFASAQWFADLVPGNYKLIFEEINPYDYQIRTGFYGLPNYADPQYILVDENDNVLIKDTDIFSELDPNVYAPTFYRKATSFTINSATRVGLISKLYSSVNLFAYRFMIVPADTVEESFAVYAYSVTFSGVTCWEPYKFKVPVTVTSGVQVTTIDIKLDEPLGANDVISKTSLGIDIPTYVGRNTIDVGTTIVPAEMYIKYNT